MDTVEMIKKRGRPRVSIEDERRVVVSLPISTYNKLSKSMTTNRRSLKGEITMILDEWFSYHDS